MKKIHFLFFTTCLSLLFSSCALFKPRYGCPSSGKDVGAEKLLDGSKVKKAKKFRA